MEIHQTSPEVLTTRFAPAERASAVTIAEQSAAVQENGLLSALLQAMPGYAMLINRQRQIVAVNGNILRITGASDIGQLAGRRPGEALNCLHSHDTLGGCGTGEHCSVCGAVLAIVASQESLSQAVSECRVTLNGPEETALDMRATATPVTINGEQFTVFVLQDISGEKRRSVLERVFFHDVSNTAGCIHGLASSLAENGGIPAHLETEYKNWLVRLSDNLLEEIHSQRRLLAAENGEFMPEFEPLSLRQLLLEVHRLYHHFDKTPGRLLVLAEGPDHVVNTDASVLRRIIGNMVQNALEASPVGAVVTISARAAGSDVVVEVHNQGEMPHEVKLQLFKRSFSTKPGTGRGIGTYSMKLFGERYLKGRVAFRSSADEGTHFSITLPSEQ